MLDLSQCGLDDEAVCRLNIGLSCCKLQKLNLSRNVFTKQGAIKLSSVLRAHPTLKELNVLKCGSMDDDGAVALLEAVRLNTTLRVLRLDDQYRRLVQVSLLNRVQFDWS